MKTILRVVLLIAVGILVACHQAISGQSSFVLLDEHRSAPPTTAKEFQINEAMSLLVGAKPIPPLATPVYPPAALAARLRDINLAAKITVDKEGKVAGIDPSFARIACTTQFREEFWRAIEAAVTQWRFEPGYLAR